MYIGSFEVLKRYIGFEWLLQRSFVVLGRLWVHLDLIIGALGGFARGFVEVEKLYKPPGQLIADPEPLESTIC